MDDVGQTLLNWASAFGTQEMVEFLCSKGTVPVPINKVSDPYSFFTDPDPAFSIE